MEFKLPASLSRNFNTLSRALTRAFPTPALISPPAAGIDISDASVKWLALEPAAGGFKVATYGELRLDEGIVENGIVKDAGALSAALREVREHLGGIRFAHAALPEESAYVFEMQVPQGTDHEQALRLIEFEFEARVPIPPGAAVFDFEPIRHDAEGEEIGVAVFPKDISESYAAAFDAAGLTLLSLELEARSIARAVASRDADSITLLVDFGRARSGFAVLKHGIPIFSSTVEVGGEGMTRALEEKLSISEEEAILFRNEQGLLPDESAQAGGLDAVTGVAITIGTHGATNAVNV
jgi:type IV pilus assembly protein PilM